MIQTLNELIKLSKEIASNSKASINTGEDAMFALEWYQEIDDMIDNSNDPDDPFTISRFYNWTYEVDGYDNELIKHPSIEEAQSYIHEYNDHRVHMTDGG